MPVVLREQGRFIKKSEEDRKVRSIRATDETWERFGQFAENRSMTRADLLEVMVTEDWDNPPEPVSSQDGLTLERLQELCSQLLEDPTVTRQGKDRGSVKRALEALLNAVASSNPDS